MQCRLELKACSAFALRLQPRVPHLHGSFNATGGNVPAVRRPRDCLHPIGAGSGMFGICEDMLSCDGRSGPYCDGPDLPSEKLEFFRSSCYPYKARFYTPQQQRNETMSHCMAIAGEPTFAQGHTMPILAAS